MVFRKSISLISRNGFYLKNLNSFRPLKTCCYMYSSDRWSTSSVPSSHQRQSNRLGNFDYASDSKDDETDAHTPNKVKASKLFLEQIRNQIKLDVTGLRNVLYHFPKVQSVVMTIREIKAIKSSPEFSDFMKAFKDHLSELNANDLQLGFRIVSWIMRHEHDLMEIILLKLSKNMNDLNHSNSVYLLNDLHFHYQNEESSLRKEMTEELRFKIENEFLKNSNQLTSTQLLSALRYVTTHKCDYWSDKALIILLKSCVEDEFVWRKMSALGSCYLIRHYLKDKNKAEVFRKLILDKLHEINDLDCEKIYFGFLKIYMEVLHLQFEELNEEIFTLLVNRLVHGIMKVDELALLTFASAYTGYINEDLVKRVKKVLFSPYEDMVLNFYTKKKYLQFVNHAMTVLVCSSVEDKDWDYVKAKLHKLKPLLASEEYMSIDYSCYLRVAVGLASLKILPCKQLDALTRSMESDENIETEAIRHKWYSLVSLHQAISIYSHDFPGPFLDEKKLLKAINILYEDSVLRNDVSCIPENIETFNRDVKSTLESIASFKNGALPDVFTKFGHHISFLIAVNKNGKFFDFSPWVNEEKKSWLWLEGINVPDNYRRILVLNYPEKYYSRNLLTLKPIAKIRVETLQHLGYSTIPILYSVWMKMSCEERKNYLTKMILWTRAFKNVPKASENFFRS